MSEESSPPMAKQSFKGLERYKAALYASQKGTKASPAESSLTSDVSGNKPLRFQPSKQAKTKAFVPDTPTESVMSTAKKDSDESTMKSFMLSRPKYPTRAGPQNGVFLNNKVAPRHIPVSSNDSSPPVRHTFHGRKNLNDKDNVRHDRNDKKDKKDETKKRGSYDKYPANEKKSRDPKGSDSDMMGTALSDTPLDWDFDEDSIKMGEVELSDNIWENCDRYQQEHRRIMLHHHSIWAKRVKAIHEASKKTANEYKNRMADLNTLLEKADDGREKQDKLIKKREGEIEIVKKRLEECMEALEEQRQANTEVRVDAERWEQKSQSAEEAFDAIQTELRTEHEKSKKKLEAKFRASEKNMETQIKNLTKENQKLVDMLDSERAVAQEEIMARNEKIEKLQNELTDLETEYHNAKTSYEKELKDLKRNIHTGNEEKDELAANFSSNLEKEKAKAEQAEKVNIEKDKKIQELQFQIQSGQKEIDYLKKAHEWELENMRIKGAVENVKLHLHVNKDAAKDYNVKVDDSVEEIPKVNVELVSNSSASESAVPTESTVKFNQRPPEPTKPSSRFPPRKNSVTSTSGKSNGSGTKKPVSAFAEMYAMQNAIR